MDKFISKRLSGLVQSDIRLMTRECMRVNGINLGQGVCDLPTYPPILEGTIQALRDRKCTYSVPEGIPELRQVISQKLLRDNGISADPDTEIVVTNGTAGGYATTLMSLLNDNDGILFFEPYYGYHVNTAIFSGLEPQFCTLQAPEFKLTEANLRASIRENTRAIVLCTPANPSGKMLSLSELMLIADIAEEKDLLVITDEIYEYFRYDDVKHISPATVKNLWNRTVTLMGLSKTFSITGWRLGYVVAQRKFTQPITLANDLFYICAPTPLQHGVIPGFGASNTYYDELLKDYARKREKICDALDYAGLTPCVPQGAYYVLADISKFGFDTSRDAALALLNSAHVAAIPGRAFYQTSEGENFLRFCFAVENELLDTACERIKRF